MLNVSKWYSAIIISAFSYLCIFAGYASAESLIFTPDSTNSPACVTNPSNALLDDNIPATVGNGSTSPCDLQLTFNNDYSAIPTGSIVTIVSYTAKSKTQSDSGFRRITGNYPATFTTTSNSVSTTYSTHTADRNGSPLPTDISNIPTTINVSYRQFTSTPIHDLDYMYMTITYTPPTPTATPTPIPPTATPTPTYGSCIDCDELYSPPTGITGAVQTAVLGLKDSGVSGLSFAVGSGLLLLISVALVYFTVRHFRSLSGVDQGGSNLDRRAVMDSYSVKHDPSIRENFPNKKW